LLEIGDCSDDARPPSAIMASVTMTIGSWIGIASRLNLPNIVYSSAPAAECESMSVVATSFSCFSWLAAAVHAFVLVDDGWNRFGVTEVERDWVVLAWLGKASYSACPAVSVPA
jgi:hypothetical protein